MTMAELLVAGMIASSSCCASLQVFSQAASASHTARTQREASELMELHWLASRRWLMAVSSACDLDAAGLEQSLAAELPLGSQLQRRLHDDPEFMGVWLELDHPSSGLERRQLFTAAGSGWCDDAAQDSTAAKSAALPAGSLEAWA
jgi:hypothetical protein